MILSTSTPSGNSETENLDFSSTYSDNLPKILEQLGVSLLATSYQSQRLIIVRSKNGKLETKLKAFPRPMGLFADKNRITLGTLNQVIDFQVSDSSLADVVNGKLDKFEEFAAKLKRDEFNEDEQSILERAEQIQDLKTADSLYIQRSALMTGMINIHDIAWGNDGLWVVNSIFSCLSKLSANHSFIACWQPPFISELKPENRCHLNGMAMLDGEPRYVTAFSQSNTKEEWRVKDCDSGVLIDVKENRILKSDISLPHSPKCHDGKVYYCASGDGAIHVYDPTTKDTQVLCNLPGFTRGMIFLGDLLIVGLSKVRESSDEGSITRRIKLTPEDSRCGIWFINANNGLLVSKLEFTGDVSQIYDIAIIPNSCKPEIISSDDVLSGHLYEYIKESNI